MCFSGAGAKSTVYSTPAVHMAINGPSLIKNHPGRMTPGTLETLIPITYALILTSEN